jgi:hypothetical protein
MLPELSSTERRTFILISSFLFQIYLYTVHLFHEFSSIQITVHFDKEICIIQYLYPFRPSITYIPYLLSPVIVSTIIKLHLNKWKINFRLTKF